MIALPRIFQVVSAVLLVLFGTAAARADETLPFEIDPQSGCVLTRQQSWRWTCDYRSPQGRPRAVLLDFFEMPLDEEGRETLKGLSAEMLELVLKDQISELDAKRDREQLPGAYRRLEYRLLDPDTRPVGFIACAQSLDQMILQGAPIRTDRAHLHCWGADRDRGVLFQLLLSLLESVPADEPATPTLAAEFDDIVASIRRE